MRPIVIATTYPRLAHALMGCGLAVTGRFYRAGGFHVFERTACTGVDCSGKRRLDICHRVGRGHRHSDGVCGCVSETAAGGCVGNDRQIEQATAGFWLKPYIGNFGMIRWGVQYSHTEVQAFTGKGGAPTAIDNIVIASFRYYPFNS
jgi:hypothetical protein